MLFPAQSDLLWNTVADGPPIRMRNGLFFYGFEESIDNVLADVDRVLRSRKCTAPNFGDEFLECRNSCLSHLLAHGVEIAVLLGVTRERRFAVAQQILGEQELDIAAGSRSDR